MEKYKELEEALSLVESLCTMEQIQDLLRTRKGDKDVRITAESKDDAVKRNLRTAIEARAIPLDAVFRLIRDSEENGNQHIFYFRSRNKELSQMMNLEFFAKNLWGANVERQTANFPAIRLKPNDFRYSDLHTPYQNKPRDWVLKIYGHAVVTRATGKVEKRGQDTFWREFVEEPLRIVLIARWNAPDLLELRVQRDESKVRVEGWLTQLWSMLKPALVLAQFEEWDLAKSLKSMILKKDSNTKTYAIRDASVLDEGVGVRFEPRSDKGTLFDSDWVSESVKRLEATDGECDGLTVTWLTGKDGEVPEKDIRTILGKRRVNEIVVGARASRSDLDYVTDQLRSHRRSAS
jgi:hypothetical protein